MRPVKTFAFIIGAVFLTYTSGCLNDSITTPEPALEGTDVSAAVEAASAEVGQLIASLEQQKADLESAGTERGVITVPAGSVDALEAAIAAAGTGGVVIVKAGLHTESETVTVPHRVSIVGLPGAVVQVDTQPSTLLQGVVDPAFHVHGAPGTWISGLEIIPKAARGGTGVLLEDSANSTVAANAISRHEIGVALEQADRSIVWANRILEGSFDGFGVVVVNAERASILSNEVSGFVFGLWPCDKKGSLFFNNCHGNFIGIILCKVVAGSFILPSGEATGAEFSGEQWVVRHNNAHDNLDAGYLVIDGANNNVLANNAAANNATYDIELVGDSFRFGFLTPFSFENTVLVASPSHTVKDCGVDNTVIGGTQIDITQDPCF